MHDLEKLWSQQNDFMKLLQSKRTFPEFPLDLSKKEHQKFVKDIANDCMHELFEAIHLLKNAKLHRSTEIPEFDHKVEINWEIKEDVKNRLEYAVDATLEDILNQFIDTCNTQTDKELSKKILKEIMYETLS